MSIVIIKTLKEIKETSDFIRTSIFYNNVGAASQDASLSRFYALMQEKGWENICNIIRNFILHTIDIYYKL